MQIPDTSKKRIVIIGGGFAGLTLADKLDYSIFQVVLIDKNNYHQFQPLLYQVATSGLQVSSIVFPFRKIFRKHKDLYFRLAEVKSIDTTNQSVDTSIGKISYDYLVIAGGTTTNFFGNQTIERKALAMKTAEEALKLRNTILLNLEEALNTVNPSEKEALMNIVIVGGGATGVEIAGALAEMKRFMIPKDYPDLHASEINIYLIEGSNQLLAAMSEGASVNSRLSLEKMGVKVLLNKKVVDYKNDQVICDDGNSIRAKTLIWVSGVIANSFEGIQPELLGRGKRIMVNEYNQVNGFDNVFAIGDICLQTEKNYPNGHPQVAPVAMQQGTLLAWNLKNLHQKKSIKAFKYNNQGTLATIGRNKAVADIRNIHLRGFTAWAVWMLVHLRSILGVRNKIVVLLDWVWNYFTYDRATRYIMFSPDKDYYLYKDKEIK